MPSGAFLLVGRAPDSEAFTEVSVMLSPGQALGLGLISNGCGAW